jgi:hypothetical protein
MPFKNSNVERRSIFISTVDNESVGGGLEEKDRGNANS